MSFAENPYSSWGTVAINAAENERADFIRKTYLHLTGAVFAFAGLEAILLQSGLGEQFLSALSTSKYSWLIVLGAFMGVSWLATNWAQSSTSIGKQYAGLGLYVVAQAVIFLPLMYYATLIDSQVPGSHIVLTAATITILSFVGLTAAAFLTGYDFSFLRTGLVFGGFAALGFIVCSILFGFALGNLFTMLMILLACGFILYDTSNVMHHYRIGQHVAAALALFASVALLFWYILQFVISMQRR